MNEALILAKQHNWNMPTVCPVCGASLEISENHKQLYCTNDFCKSRFSGRITKWVGTLGIKELGLTTIEKFLDFGIIETISSLYCIDYSKIETMEGFGEKSAENIRKEIESHKKLTLAKFIAGYNIDSIGEKVAEKIIADKKVKSLNDLMSKRNDLVCEGVGEITANKLKEGLEALYSDMEETLKYVTIIEEKTSTVASGKLNGKSFCFTGAASRPRKELQKMVLDNGGVVHDAIKKSPLTDYLVIADVNSTSSKAVSARKLGVNLISEEDFLRLLSHK